MDYELLQSLEDEGLVAGRFALFGDNNGQGNGAIRRDEMDSVADVIDVPRAAPRFKPLSA